MTTTFKDLGVPEAVVDRLRDRGIDQPFDIQALTLRDALAGHDICGRAPTGSGKTIAFGIPLVSMIDRASPKRPKGLVLVPTRELALQVAEELSKLGDLRVLAVYGGTKIEPQMKKLRAGVDIVVACPGRLEDVIDRRACDLRDVEMVVLDEADRMADMGFLPAVRRILDQTANRRQTLLWSATLDGAVDTLIRSYQRDPIVHEVAEDERGETTHHLWLTADRAAKVAATAGIVERGGPTVVFSRTKHGADRTARQLTRMGVRSAAIHGNRSQSQRERALGDFHRGDVSALVATDVAARGIHVEGVKVVVHFDLPADHKDYVHRSGRTGRAGEDGMVIGLLSEPQRKESQKLLRKAGLDVPVTPVELEVVGPRVETDSKPRSQPGRSQGGEQNRNGSPPAPARKRSGRGSSGSGGRGGRGGRGGHRSGGGKRPQGQRTGGGRGSQKKSAGRSSGGRRRSSNGSNRSAGGRSSAGRGGARGRART